MTEELWILTIQQAIKKRNVTLLGSSDCQRFKIYQDTQKMKLTVWSVTGRVDGPQGTEQSGELGYKQYGSEETDILGPQTLLGSNTGSGTDLPRHMGTVPPAATGPTRQIVTR